MALDGRKERFAQLVAAGSSQTAAYKAAGYKGEGSTARSGAARLAAVDEVKYRIKELQDEQLRQLRERQADAATAAGIDIEWLQKSGKDLFYKALEREDFSAASQTLERIAKISGLWLDRPAADENKVIRVYSALPITEEEWEQMYGADSDTCPDKIIRSN